MNAGRFVRRLLVALAIALAPHPRADAAEWVRAFGTADSERSLDAAIAADGSSFVLASTSAPLGPDRLSLARFDPAGRLEWARAVGAMSSPGADPALSVTTGGGCVLAFGRPDGIDAAAFDATGSVTWQRIAGGVGIVSLLEAAPASGGDVIFVGHVPNTVPPFGGNWVMCVDASGAVRWQAAHVDPGVSMRVRAVIATADGGALLTGDLAFAADEAFLMKLDATGGEEWTLRIQDSAQPVSANAVVELPGGGFVVGGTKTSGPWVMSLDPGGTPGWLLGPTTTMAGDGSPQLALLPSGEVVMGFNVDSPATGKPACALIAFETAGTVAWQRLAGIPARRLTRLGALADGILLIGEDQDLGPGSIDALLVRTGIGGSLPPECIPPDPSSWDWADTNLDVGPFVVASEPRSPVITSRARAFPSSAWVAVDACGCLPDMFEEDDACAPAGELPHLLAGATEFREGCDDPVDWMSFDACAGETHVLATSGLEANADTVLEVFLDDCATSLATDDNGGGGLASRIDFVAPADGTYRLRVENVLGAGMESGYEVSLAAPCTPATWLRTLETTHHERLWCVIPLASGGFAALGDFDVGDREDPWILLLGPDGSTERQFALAGTGGIIVPQLVELADGDLLVMGIEQRDRLWPEPSPFAMRVDPVTGSARWHFVMDGGGMSAFRDGLERADGSILLAGSWEVGDDASILLVEVDAAGNLIRQRTLGTPGDEYAVGLEPLPGGGALMVGWAGSPTPTAGLLVTLDAAGEMTWQRRYDTVPASLGISFSAATIDANGDILVIANTDQSPALMRVDAAGNSPVVRKLAPRFGSIASVAVRADRSIVVAGLTHDASPGGDGWIEALDPAGVPIWQNRIGRVDYIDSLKGLAVLPDGGLLVVGDFQDPGYGDTDAVIAKLRPDGSVSAGSCGLMRATSFPTSAVPTIATTPTLVFGPLALTVLAPPLTTTETRTVVREHCVGFAPVEPPPDEVSPRGSAQPLIFTSHDDFEWEEAAASRSVTFNVYRGDVTSLRGRDYGACLMASVMTNAATDPALPGGGVAWFYLVTGRNAAGEGPMGFDSYLVPRVNGAPCP